MKPTYDDEAVLMDGQRERGVVVMVMMEVVSVGEKKLEGASKEKAGLPLARKGGIT
jgi:hypothetical protein